MKKFILAALLLPLLSVAQTTGTLAPKETTVENKDGLRLEQGSWTEILAKAKKENKYIIMDCMTTWCGPCKHMDKNVFPLKETGDFFNEKFLAVKVQFDSTADDDARVKSWKKDMKEIEKEYAINAYPTYLIFDPNGQVVHRTVGATPDAKMFIAKGKEGLVPETQYYTQLRRYQNGEKDPAFLRKMATMAATAYDTKMSMKIAQDYIAGMTDFYSKENAQFLAQFTSTSKDKGFELMLNNPEKMDAILGAGKSKAKVVSIIATEEMNPGLRKMLNAKTPNPDPSAVVASASQKYPQFAADLADMASKLVYSTVYSQEVYSPMAKALDAKTKADWDAISASVHARDSKNADEMLAKGKMVYFQNTKDWPAYTAELGLFMTKFGEKATAAELNSYAWTVFDNCKDMACVNLALGWSERSIKDEKMPGVYMYMDTYANILHRIGRTKEAIQWQEKALALAPDGAKETYTATLNKMKKGEKTWAVTEE
ncbi:MAG: thioredoxin fold domain-containing protein [Bacteroidota bacterium]